MTCSPIYLIILIIGSIGLIVELPHIISGFVLSDIILTLYISYLIKAFFIYPINTSKS